MDGLKIYNNYLRKKFGLAICKLERFYNYAKLSALSNDMVTQTESTMESLINILNKEDNNSPFEFLMELKSMMGEPSSTIKDIREDLEVEPSTINQWWSKHSVTFLAIVSLIGTPIIGFVLTIVLHVTI